MGGEDAGGSMNKYPEEMSLNELERWAGQLARERMWEIIHAAYMLGFKKGGKMSGARPKRSDVAGPEKLTGA